MPKTLAKDYLAALKETLDRLPLDGFAALAQAFRQARDRGARIFVMGNGGSAATAAHLACDLNKGACRPEARRFRVLCLNDNLPTLLAYSNDLSYAEVLLEQLKNFLEPGDVALGISGSGNSENVVRALEWAKSQGAVTAALTGYDGGRMGRLADIHCNVPVADMQIAEDAHLIVAHMLMRVFCRDTPAC